MASIRVMAVEATGVDAVEAIRLVAQFIESGQVLTTEQANELEAALNDEYRKQNEESDGDTRQSD